MGEFGDNDVLEKLIEEAKASGGSELANYQLFVIGLTEALALERPQMASEENAFNDYVFERRVDFKHPDGTRTAGRIDCYRRDCFILEAKQSAKRKKLIKADPDQLHLLPEEALQQKPGQAKRGTKSWDKVMLSARKQAEDYARALPVEHGYPPFLLIVDVGNVIEIFADFSGQGKNYAHFPDRRSYRISMDSLREANVQDRLRAIWTDPHSLDPARKSAEVTRDVAARLAKIAKRLEGKHDPKAVAEFLMRCLFTMFAEDVGLVPQACFADLLERLKNKPDQFVPQLENLWRVMDKGGFEPLSGETLKRFNGTLFKTRTALPLDADGISELWIAAKRDWQDVEPAIFGTLLERALDQRERSKLGVHYTPRAYVERLVVPTIIEPLREDWEAIQARVEDLHNAGEDKAAIKVVKDFHHRLCTIRVLDPACGTGNFLYVSLELIKRLEGEVLEALDALGEDAMRFAFEGETVGPRQFYGLEINPRAVPIADLVLWIGFLKWQMKTAGVGSISEPILHAYGTIVEQDAILAYDRQELLRDEHGKPLSRWDGVTKKLHPITGEEIPDPDATIPLYSYGNPRPAEWPDADFIVGNPPFIGNKRMIERLGEDYVEPLRSAHKRVPESVDLVMYWWARCADLLSDKKIRSFGLVTTSKIIQTFNRKIVERKLRDKEFSIVYAVDNMPWSDDETSAAVRVSMTVCRSINASGTLLRIKDVKNELSERSEFDETKSVGTIDAMLRVGASLSSTSNLKSNALIAHQGVTPSGLGFRFTTGDKKSDLSVLPTYIIGRDLTQRRQFRQIIDFFGLSETEAKTLHPELFQIVLDRVKPDRDQNRRRSYRENYWLFVEPRSEMRRALRELNQQIVTTRTSRQRFFQFEPSATLCDAKIIVIADSSAANLAVLSSRQHVDWSNRWAKLGSGNDPNYNHSECYNNFPFPACLTDDSNPDLRNRLGELGERLDAFRKERLEAHEFLTMTGMYNVLERVRELDAGIGEPLTAAEKDIYDTGLIGILKDIHDEIDRATFEAYGWQDLGDRLVGKPGATMPSPHKSEDQETAEEELLSRLVALNIERQAEEARGHVRWLRPDYQIPKLGHKVAAEQQIEADVAVVPTAEQQKWPKDGLTQIRLVREVLLKAGAPSLPDEISASFHGRNTAKRKDRVAEVLETLVATGSVRTGELEGETRYFVAR